MLHLDPIHGPAVDKRDARSLDQWEFVLCDEVVYHLVRDGGGGFKAFDR
jgi:hypothetical protein